MLFDDSSYEIHSRTLRLNASYSDSIVRLVYVIQVVIIHDFIVSVYKQNVHT